MTIFRGAIWACAAMFAMGGTVDAAAQDAPSLIRTLVAHEDAAVLRWPPFRYIAEERSDRTGGHLWTERVAETSFGRVRCLIEEDGKPLSSERAAKEREKLAEIAAHPEAFRKREQALRDDDVHAARMLDLLEKAFLFDPPQPAGENLRIGFHPNPAYSPQSIEERVLHAMSGSLLIEPRSVRLRAIEGRLPTEVSIGFGFIATIKAGSSFATTRRHIEGDEWKMETLETNITGRAIFFKTIAKTQHEVHRDFHRLPAGITPAEAVAMLEQ